MRNAARVASIGALRDFRAALIEFMDEVKSALDEADHEVARVGSWIEHDQVRHWQGLLRRYSEEVVRAKSEVTRKQMTTSPDERARSAIDEKKRLEMAQRRLQEAERKIEAAKKWSRAYAREAMEYRGPTSQLATTVELELPSAVAALDRMTRSLERYVQLQPPTTTTTTTTTTGTGAAVPDTEHAGMARAAGPLDAAEPERSAESRPIEHYRSVRGRSLPPRRRAGVALTILPDDDEINSMPEWSSSSLLAGIGVAPVPVSAADKVVMAPGCLIEDRLYLVRALASADGDSGWFICSEAEVDVADDFEALAAATVCAIRMDLHALLALPPGCMAVVDGDHLEIVLDANDVVLHGPSSTSP